MPLVAALAAKLRTVAKVAGAQGSSAQIARQLGMQPWLVEQAQRDVRRWTPEGLVRSIQVTAEADAQVKGLSRDPVYAVEHAVTVIATSVRRRLAARKHSAGGTCAAPAASLRERPECASRSVKWMWPAPEGAGHDHQFS